MSRRTPFSIPTLAFIVLGLALAAQPSAAQPFPDDCASALQIINFPQADDLLVGLLP